MEGPEGLTAGLDSAGPSNSEGPDCLHRSGPGLWHRRPGHGQDRAGCLLSIEPVRLAVRVASCPVGPIHLEDLSSGALEEAGERRSIEPGAFDADCSHLPEGSQPGPQLTVPARGRGEAAVAKQLSVAVDHSGVMRVLVGVDPTNDVNRRLCHAWSAPR